MCHLKRWLAAFRLMCFLLRTRYRPIGKANFARHQPAFKERLSHRTLTPFADRDAETREAASPPEGSYPVYPRCLG